ncbi:hypothetical protein BH11CYA1_BH11CYA1_07450 [soil metagenome]
MTTGLAAGIALFECNFGGDFAAAQFNGRPQYTPSDVNGSSLYLNKNNEASIFQNADALSEEKKWKDAIVLWDKLLKLHPNCPAIVLRRSLDMRDSGFVRPALHALENLIKDTEAKGQSYYLPFYFLADSYSRCGETKKAEDACLKILKKFPQSVEAARGMLIINRRLHSQKVADESLRQFAYLSEHPPKYDTTFSTMKFSFRQPLPAGYAYEIMVGTDCFPRFKMIMTSDRVVGDTGVVKYIIGPPNYDQVILLNDESQNYFKTTIAAMMLDHCNRKVGESRFGKVIKLGDKTILGKSCVELKCQEFGESSYETVALAKDIAIVKPLARTVSLICGAPVSEYLPLSDTLVKDGYPSQRLTVTSIRKVKVTPNMMTLNPKYHQVKNKGELIYASNGDLKDSDLDQFLQSK